jgi:predicted RNA-binding Zn-ribbon protein involved in translation (DUF1610 family)
VNRALSLPARAGFVVTPKGHQDLVELPTCSCAIRLVGLIFECPECGTIYGSVRDQDAGRYARQDKPL